VAHLAPLEIDEQRRALTRVLGRDGQFRQQRRDPIANGHIVKVAQPGAKMPARVMGNGTVIGSTRTAIAIGVISLACLTGCRGASTSTDSAGAQPTPTPQATPTASPTLTAAPPPPERTPVVERTATPVNVNALVALIPDISGWTRTPPHGTQSHATIPLSEASAEYTQGDATLKLDIMDSGFNRLILAPLSMMLAPGYSERTADGYKQFAVVDGAPGFETWQDDVGEGSVTVLVADRFVVTGRGLNVPGINIVRAAVRAVDFAKLATLK